MHELDVERFAGRMETAGLEGGAVVHVELDRLAMAQQQSPKAEAQGGEVLVEVVAGFTDETTEVVDEGTQQRAPHHLRAGCGVHVRAVVEVAHHQLEDGAGLDPAVDLLAQTAQ